MNSKLLLQLVRDPASSLEKFQTAVLSLSQDDDAAILLNHRYSQNRTLLHHAIDIGQIEIARDLMHGIAHKAGFVEIAAIDDDGCSCLHYAVRRCRDEIVEEIIKNFTFEKINDNDNNNILLLNRDVVGRTVLDVAVMFAASSTLEILLNSLQEHCSHLLKSLLRMRDKQGGTILHRIISEQKANVVLQCIQNNDDKLFLFLTLDDHGNTILHSAANSSLIPLITVLSDAAKNVKGIHPEWINKRNDDGLTILHLLTLKSAPEGVLRKILGMEEKEDEGEEGLVKESSVHLELKENNDDSLSWTVDVNLGCEKRTRPCSNLE